MLEILPHGSIARRYRQRSMNPQQYEQLVAEHFRVRGYTTWTTPCSGDYGVDAFATKGSERIAIQAKMYGKTARRVNREMVMQLHGAKDYFECTKAVIATDGAILEDAREVAMKLGIEILNIAAQALFGPVPRTDLLGSAEFDEIWVDWIMPLRGKVLTRSDGKTNEIVNVDWSGIERITSNGQKQTIQIEIFRKTVNHLLRHGSITRIQINEEYAKRASSGILLILAQVPLFEIMDRPLGLRLRDK